MQEIRTVLSWKEHVKDQSWTQQYSLLTCKETHCYKNIPNETSGFKIILYIRPLYVPSASFNLLYVLFAMKLINANTCPKQILMYSSPSVSIYWDWWVGDVYGNP